MRSGQCAGGAANGQRPAVQDASGQVGSAAANEQFLVYIIRTKLLKCNDWVDQKIYFLPFIRSLNAGDVGRD